MFSIAQLCVVSPEYQTVVMTAAAQNQGIEGLEGAIATAVQQGNLQAANLDLAINQRQAEVLARAHVALGHTLRSVVEKLPLDFWSIDLRGAVQALGEITGEDVTESVLDRIFSRFCIGK
jgi:tRNA modification GTPase